MSRSSIEMQIAERVCDAERAHARMLGYDAIDVPMMGFGAFCEVWAISLAPERPAVWPRGSEPRVI